MSPRLTVCAMVSNAEDRFEHWAERILEFADEFVVCVDSASADATLDMARSLADKVAVFAHTGVNLEIMDWGSHFAMGDWILWLDDDDLTHRDFPERVRPLLEDRSVTHYWQPYRWLVDDAGTLSWIRQFPWYPNPVVRLFRNIGGIFAHAGRHHSPFDVMGDARLLHDDELALWHSVFLIRDREALRTKVARYRAPGVSCEEYYLLDEAGPLTLEPAPADALIRDPSPEAQAEAARRRQRPAKPIDELPFADAATVRRYYGRHRDEAEIYAADYPSHDTPAAVPANQGASARVTVRNNSAYPWRAYGLRRGRVVLSYHWEHEGAGTLVRQGDISALPYNVEPGGEVTVDAGFWAPYEPGDYQLVWDLQREEVSWF
ncbi:MAG: glycosyltransferase, partial [Acidimicrobiales bacterium]